MTARATAKKVSDVLAELARQGTQANRDGMARYAIVAPFGVSVGSLRKLAKTLGRDHDLAGALWLTGWYEARMLGAFVDDPEAVTAAQMEQWAKDFDNWAICDTVCFHLFDRVPAAWRKIAPWSRKKAEFHKRAAFALVASLALHDRTTGDEAFLGLLDIIEAGASDGRNFVKKGVSWALRGIGHRNATLHARAVALGQRLSAADDAAQRWVGKDALRDLTRPAVVRRVTAGA